MNLTVEATPTPTPVPNSVDPTKGNSISNNSKVASSASNANIASAGKILPATGNPIALLCSLIFVGTGIRHRK